MTNLELSFVVASKLMSAWVGVTIIKDGYLQTAEIIVYVVCAYSEWERNAAESLRASLLKGSKAYHYAMDLVSLKCTLLEY